ncbi:MAG: glycoside hydrolase family 3 C-terminal domain-containing protein [Bacteroidales bacterium]|nr:MAG: glycoside hydrolase family 3 C-terminal domain-containing protein [Bacteroidales bacterium]
MKNIYILSLTLLLTTCEMTEIPEYKNSGLPVKERVEDLFKRMTLEEKVGQLFSHFLRDTSITLFNDNDELVGIEGMEDIKHGVGAFFTFEFIDWKTFKRKIGRINNFQRYLIDSTRLGIPALMFAEGLHGAMINGATSFPQAIALGCTWDTVLLEQIFDVAAVEAHASGAWQVLSPVLDLARDPRWGRTEECYSEDPYLVSRMAMAAVNGFQGRGENIKKDHVAVTLKHFAGHGQSEGGRNISPVNYSEREFRSLHLYPFEIAVKHANAQSIMASYNEWDGIPNHVNRKLLIDILRDEWGFDGFVMSDGGGLDVTYRSHMAATDSAESGVISIINGIDYDLSSRGCFSSLIDQVKKGNVSEKHIDRAVKNILRVKFRSGLFDRPYINESLFDSIANNKNHKQLALKAAHEAMILLKNKNNILPLDSNKIKTLAVIGPNAKGIHLGGYSPVPMYGVDILEGIRQFAKNKFRVLYAEGCKITTNKECHWRFNENPVLNDPEDDKKLIIEAVNIARQSDGVILAIGENELVNREAWSENHLGDKDNLDLPGMQNELVKAILQTGKPAVVLLINGRPLTINYIAEEAPAVIECWYLGQETGHAVADVLFGRVNPSGKLTITFPRSVGQLPCFYNKKPSSLREYVLAESTPLFPFGFGLSYTSFEYSNLKVTPEIIPVDGTAEVTVDITNSGKVKGDEIVQLYIHDLVSLPTRPVKELKDFKRITIEPGKTETVKFLITKEKLEAFGMDMKREVQPGEFEIMAGKNSVDVITDTLTVE